MVAGSTPVTSCSLPATSALSMRTFEAAFTSGTRAIASPSAAANETPSGPSTMYAALTWSVTADSTDLRRPAPSTATTVTSVSPTISAAAVDAVRLGLRTEFELARSPAIPPLRRAGAPTSRASGFTRCGAASATPRNRVRMPMPSRAASAIVLSPLANTPTEMAATEPATTTAAAFSECAAKREGGRIEPSRTAAIGGTRGARRAGGRRGGRRRAVPPPRGQDARDQRDERAEREGDDDGPWREHQAGIREVGANQRGHRLGESDPGEEPDHGGQEADHQALEHDRAHHLLA